MSRTIIDIFSGTTTDPLPELYDGSGNAIKVHQIDTSSDDSPATDEAIARMEIEDNGDGSHTLKLEGNEGKTYAITGITIQEVEL